MAQQQASTPSTKYCSIPPSFDASGKGFSDAPDPTPHASHGDPRRALLLAVLERALADCRGHTANSQGVGAAMMADREAAFRSLTDQTGPHARWRRQLCALCGIDPAAFDKLVAEERGDWPEIDRHAKRLARERHAQHIREYQRRRRAEAKAKAEAGVERKPWSAMNPEERKREASRLCMQRKR